MVSYNTFSLCIWPASVAVCDLLLRLLFDYTYHFSKRPSCYGNKTVRNYVTLLLNRSFPPLADACINLFRRQYPTDFVIHTGRSVLLMPDRTFLKWQRKNVTDFVDWPVFVVWFSSLVYCRFAIASTVVFVQTVYILIFPDFQIQRRRFFLLVFLVVRVCINWFVPFLTCLWWW